MIHSELDQGYESQWPELPLAVDAALTLWNFILSRCSRKQQTCNLATSDPVVIHAENEQEKARNPRMFGSFVAQSDWALYEINLAERIARDSSKSNG